MSFSPAVQNFLKAQNWDGAAAQPVAGDADYRRYTRLTKDGKTAILMEWAPNNLVRVPWLPADRYIEHYVDIANLFLSMGLSAPQIYAFDAADGLILLEDFGSGLYFNLLEDKKADEETLYRLATDVLVHLHKQPSEKFSQFTKINQELWRAQIDWVFEWFFAGRKLSDSAQKEWDEAWAEILPLTTKIPTGLMIWDYHSPNLMYLPDREGVKQCGILDFQDALLGPCCLDLFFLLEDPRRDVNADVVKTMQRRYLDAFPDIDEAAFWDAYAVVGAARNTRLVGNFYRLWKRDNKPHYMKFMPRVWRHLDGHLAHPKLQKLAKWFAAYVPDDMRELPDEVKHLVA